MNSSSPKGGGADGGGDGGVAGGAVVAPPLLEHAHGGVELFADDDHSSERGAGVVDPEIVKGDVAPATLGGQLDEGVVDLADVTEVADPGNVSQPDM
jgi:hypothetical protein